MTPFRKRSGRRLECFARRVVQTHRNAKLVFLPTRTVIANIEAFRAHTSAPPHLHVDSHTPPTRRRYYPRTLPSFWRARFLCFRCRALGRGVVWERVWERRRGQTAARRPVRRRFHTSFSSF